MINDITNYEKQALDVIYKIEDKPLQRLVELLVQLSTQPIKSN